MFAVSVSGELSTPGDASYALERAHNTDFPPFCTSFPSSGAPATRGEPRLWAQEHKAELELELEQVAGSGPRLVKSFVGV